ncbi:MAG: glycosyltransferase family 2 protein [Candidatus Aenigmarchaeota archaeon]|nr:glycosyltransferase family 2 protein [Candidatus Aenigmarchaeota archaeon]
MNPAVSVVIVNYNGKAWLKKCLGSITNQDYPKEKFEIIVVDNQSKDDSIGFLKGNFPSVKIVESGGNLGYAGGGNVGYSEAKGDYVALMANDMIFKADWLRTTVDFMEKNERTAVASGVLITGEDFSGRRDAVNLSPVFTGREDAREITESIMPWGGACIIRKKLFDLPFDSEHFCYCEDAYLGLNSWLRGYDVKVLKDAPALHMGSVTIGFMSPMQVYWNERNRLTNALVFLKPLTLILLSPLYIFDVFLKTLYFTARLKPELLATMYSAVLWNFYHIIKVLGKRKRIQEGRVAKDTIILSKLCTEMYGNNSLLKRSLNLVFSAYYRLIKGILAALGV